MGECSHDIGKVGIDDAILKKPSKLNQFEYEKIKRHASIGFRIAKSVSHLESFSEYILTHHERWDGTGYPRGLSKTDIPLPSRILAIADAYDAMTNDRVYRKAMSRDEAILEIKQNKGTQFDPELVDVFLTVIEKEKIIQEG